MQTVTHAATALAKRKAAHKAMRKAHRAIRRARALAAYTGSIVNFGVSFTSPYTVSGNTVSRGKSTWILKSDEILDCQADALNIQVARFAEIEAKALANEKAEAEPLSIAA